MQKTAQFKPKIGQGPEQGVYPEGRISNVHNYIVTRYYLLRKRLAGVLLYSSDRQAAEETRIFEFLAHTC
jgi:hypothetical protein